MKKVIKYFVMDVDGTLTDGKIYIGASGEIFKVFDIKDGCGIHDILIPQGIIPVVITGRASKIVEIRCKELGIVECHQGIKNKIEILEGIISKTKYEYSDVAYMGDDINDLPCMKMIKKAGGIVGCPIDAASPVKELADFVSKQEGGNGAVREFIEWVTAFQ